MKKSLTKILVAVLTVMMLISLTPVFAAETTDVALATFYKEQIYARETFGWYVDGGVNFTDENGNSNVAYNMWDWWHINDTKDTDNEKGNYHAVINRSYAAGLWGAGACEDTHLENDYPSYIGARLMNYNSNKTVDLTNYSETAVVSGRVKFTSTAFYPYAYLTVKDIKNGNNYVGVSLEKYFAGTPANGWRKFYIPLSVFINNNDPDYQVYSYAEKGEERLLDPSAINSMGIMLVPKGGQITKADGEVYMDDLIIYDIPCPAGLTVKENDETSASITWSAPEKTASSYDVYRNGVKIGSSTSTRFSDKDLDPNTEYKYTVRALYSDGSVSGHSNVATAYTAKKGFVAETLASISNGDCKDLEEFNGLLARLGVFNDTINTILYDSYNDTVKQKAYDAIVGQKFTSVDALTDELFEQLALASGKVTFIPDEEVEIPEDTTPDDDWAHSFEDIKYSDWYYEAVKYAVQNKLFNGTSATTFSPDEVVTRGMLVTVLYRASGEPAVTGISKFTDVPRGAYYERAVIWAEQNGIVTGYSDTEFAPDSTLSREQIAAIIYRYAKYKEMDTTVGENTNILSYNDYNQISDYAISGLQYSVGSGIMAGKTGSTLNPLDPATRAEVATILMRFMKL